MLRIVLTVALVLVIIYAVPFLAYGLFSVVADLSHRGMPHRPSFSQVCS
jgi:hypothetical protein